MKICLLCKIKKEDAEFHKAKTAKDGLHSRCKECRKEYMQKYYQQNKERIKRGSSVAKKLRINKNRQLFLEYLTEHSCVDCGNDDIRILEFDHVRGEKTNGVGEFVRHGYSWNRVLEEISKCDVVCPNCHRIRTYKKLNSYRIHDEEMT